MMEVAERTRDAAEQARSAAEQARSAAERARDAAEQAGCHASEQARQAAEQARDAAEKTRDAAQRALRDTAEQAERDAVMMLGKFYASQKMEAIGRLACGTAHDMNNILAGIMGFAFSGMSDSDADSEGQAVLQSIVDLCTRGRDLTKKVLGFARCGQYQRIPLSLEQIAARVTGLVRHATSRPISFGMAIDTSLPAFIGDPEQISLVMTNLCINAVDAMPAGGRVTVIGKEVELREGQFSLPAGSYVRIDVSDTGVGMDAHTLERAVEPFYTTKPLGRGTGLGLSMAYECAQQHGGTLALDSVRGSGTTVTLYLPSVTGHAVDLTGQRGEVPEFKRMNGVVLLVDDEEAIRTSGKRILERFDLDVLIAGDGKEALAIFAKRIEEISLVILDLVMPAMDGRQTFHELRKARPDIRVLIASGQSDEETTQNLLASGVSGFLQKPYSPQQLQSELLSLGLHTVEGLAHRFVSGRHLRAVV